MTIEPILLKIQKEWHGTYKSYLIGFFVSFFLTSLSFFLVIAKPFSNIWIIYSVIILAILQAIVQLIFFLHIGQESKPRFKTYFLIFSIFILFIFVVGSIWVMNDLEFRMMPEMSTRGSHTHD